jgi:hypothetical protein
MTEKILWRNQTIFWGRHKYSYFACYLCTLLHYNSGRSFFTYYQHEHKVYFGISCYICYYMDGGFSCDLDVVNGKRVDYGCRFEPDELMLR